MKSGSYEFYDEIPFTIVDYILTVSEKTDITQVPIVEINGFLRGMDEYCEEQERTFALTEAFGGA